MTLQQSDKPLPQTPSAEWGDASTPRMRAALKEHFDAPEWKLSKELFETGQQLERELAEAVHDSMAIVLENARLLEQLAQRPSRLAPQDDLIYVPGLLRCKKCGFELSKRTLNMAHGSITANNEPDTCQNDGSPMWRVSEREYREQLFNDLLGTRNHTLDFAARVCRDLIEKQNARGRLQAAAILEAAAKELEGRKTEEGSAPSATGLKVSVVPIVKRFRDQRDEIWEAALAVLKHCDAQPEGETEFERAVIALRAACAKVPSYTERLDNIFKGLAEAEADFGTPDEKANGRPNG